MLYDAIFVDMFNLGYRLCSQETDVNFIAKTIVKHIEKDIRPQLNDSGCLYLLFDPIGKVESGTKKTFVFNTTRQMISSKYKKTRQRSPYIYEAMRSVKSFYTFRGEKVKIVIDRELEADDFVEELLEIEKGRVAMVSNDLDWSRYISDRVDLINKDFVRPYTIMDYREQFGLKPTIASITLRKAIFGDESDNIHGIFSLKKAVYSEDIKDLAEDAVKYIAENDVTLEDMLKSIKKSTVLPLTEDRSSFDEFVYVVKTSISPPSEEEPIDKLLDNLRVIRSRGKDIKKCIFWHPVKADHNKLWDKNMGLTKAKISLSFGN